MALSTSTCDRRARSAINITPLIDIVLVLLIIFMLVSPVMLRQISVAIPPDAPPDGIPEHEPLKVHVRGDGAVSIERGRSVRIVPRVDLARAIRASLADEPGPVFVRPDMSLSYGEVVSALDTIVGAGATEIALHKHDPANEPL